jgi:hypothetical protein
MSTVQTTAKHWLAALSSLEHSERPGKRLAEYVADMEVDWKAARENLKAQGDALLDFEKVFPVDADDAYALAAHSLFAVLGARNLPDFRPQDRVVEGDLEVGEDDSVVVTGDLRVSGNLIVKNKLVVFGSLEVGGAYTDLCSNIATVVVGGDVRCGTHLLTEGCFVTAGQVAARLIFFSFNQGFAKVLDGCKAKALLESDHGGTRVFGPVTADIVIRDEIVVDDEDALPEGIELDTLRSIFVDELFAKIDPTEELDERAFVEAVYMRLESKKPVLKR